MEFHNIFEYAPIVMAVVVCANALMTGLYASLSKLSEQSKSYPTNVYIQGASKVASGVMKFLDVIGYHPVRPEIKQEIKRNTIAIKKLKDKSNGRLSKKIKGR